MFGSKRRIAEEDDDDGFDVTASDISGRSSIGLLHMFGLGLGHASGGDQ